MWWLTLSNLYFSRSRFNLNPFRTYIDEVEGESNCGLRSRSVVSAAVCTLRVAVERCSFAVAEIVRVQGADPQRKMAENKAGVFAGWPNES